MRHRLLSQAIYVVRATGLFFVGVVSLFLVFQPLLSKTPSVGTSLAGVWVLLAVAFSWPRLPDAWRRDPPTERQIEYATSLGIVIPPGVSKGELSEMISSATGR